MSKAEVIPRASKLQELVFPVESPTLWSALNLSFVLGSVRVETRELPDSKVNGQRRQIAFRKWALSFKILCPLHERFRGSRSPGSNKSAH